MTLSNLYTLLEDSLRDSRNLFAHQNILIIGENSSGKSKLFKVVLKRLSTNENKLRVYFIDVCNRTIPMEIKELNTLSSINIADIVQYRLKDSIFNKEDAFTNLIFPEIILKELIENESYYNILFNEILGLNFRISKDKNNEGLMEEEILPDEIIFSNVPLNLVSSAYHSMIRIIIETDYASKNNVDIVFIDEFDINLDYKNASLFLMNLCHYYSKIRFIVSAYLAYTVVGAENFDIIKIEKNYTNSTDENNILFYDSNDMDNFEIVHHKFFNSKTYSSEVDYLLSEKLKMVLTGRVIDINGVENLTNLTVKQELVRDFILKKVNDEN